MDFLLFVGLLVAMTTSAFSDTGHPISFSQCDEQDVCSTPAVIYFGKDNGDLVRCVYDNPNRECEVFHNTGSAINAVLIRGEYIYAGLRSGDIVRCILNVKQSCSTFFSCHEQVQSLTAGRGLIFVGLRGTMLRCDESCSSQRLYGISKHIYGLLQIDEDIYVGVADGEIRRCSLTSHECERLFGTRRAITGMTQMGKNIYAVTSGELWNCSPDNGPGYCEPTYLNDIMPWGLAAFKGSLYINSFSMGTCKWKGKTCVGYANQTNVWSIAMAYGTHNMQSSFKNENTFCNGVEHIKCGVIYYNEHHRATLEVKVKNGSLYDAQDSLVDTSDANEGHSGPAAIFAMGPEGRILLSKTHGGPIRTSSFFAGNPVSGAGEMIVQNGVIKKIRACSEHYLPDLDMNEQVIESLRTQGYTASIHSEAC